MGNSGSGFHGPNKKNFDQRLTSDVKVNLNGLWMELFLAWTRAAQSVTGNRENRSCRKEERLPTQDLVEETPRRG